MGWLIDMKFFAKFIDYRMRVAERRLFLVLRHPEHDDTPDGAKLYFREVAKYRR